MGGESDDPRIESISDLSWAQPFTLTLRCAFLSQKIAETHFDG
jgi:hypothetical protein